MKTEIKLYNREGGNLKLIYIGGNFWNFSSDRPEYFERWARFLLEPDNKTISGFDPPGGPLLEIGDIIEGYKILSIQSNLIFELKEEDTEL